MKRFWLILFVVVLSVLTQVVGAQSSDPASVWVTIQKFERGMMWWRSDNSTIWVLSNQGQVKTFPATSYSAYRDNRITSSPTGRVPMFGFGKVWGNFDSVRRMIGSPTTGEFGVGMKISSSGSVITAVHSDGTIYTINNNQWSSVVNPGPTQPASIRFFTATVDKIDAASLRNGSARIYVEWAVDNRPANSNLVFEQVFANGTTKNVELPRTNPIVGSSGHGVVAPIVPPNAVPELIIQLRLISLSGSTVYHTRQIKIAIVENENLRINQFMAVRNDDKSITLTWDMTGISTGRIVYGAPGSDILGTVTDVISAKGTFRTGTQPLGDTFTLEAYTVPGRVLASASTKAPAPGFKINSFTATRNADKTIMLTWDMTGINGGRISYIPVGGTTASSLTTITTAKGSFTTPTEAKDYTYTLEGYNVAGTILAVQSSTVPRDTMKIVQFTGTRSNDNSINFSWEFTGTGTGRITYTDATTNTIATLTDLTASIGTFKTTTEAKDNLYTLELYQVPGTVLASEAIKVLPVAQPASFTVSPLTINEGGTVTITWNVPGASSVKIQMLHSALMDSNLPIPNGSDNLPSSGTVEVAIPSPLDQVSFVVVGSDLPSYTVDVTCNTAPLFAGLTRCPLAASSTAPGVYQSFERGFMVWVEGTIWVFYTDNGVARSYADTWDGVTAMVAEAAPSGLYQPDRGFGYLWANTPDIRQHIGWATGAEQSYTVKKQVMPPRSSQGEGLLLSLPNGRGLYITSEGELRSYLMVG